MGRFPLSRTRGDGGAGGGAVKVASLPLPSLRSVTAPAVRRGLAARSGAGGWSGGRGGAGGPELRGPAAGGDLGDGRSTGCLEGAERVIDLAGGLVVLEGVADLAAGQAGRVGDEGGVDLFGERLAGRAGQGPARGAGGVVLERERGGRCWGPICCLPSARA